MFLSTTIDIPVILEEIFAPIKMKFYGCNVKN
jgi:hypothetical protein